MKFAGKRPVCLVFKGLSLLGNQLFSCLPLPLVVISSVPTLHSSMFIPPTPYFNMFCATVPSNGFLAITIGSNAGLSAVPQPSHCFASSVDGIVILALLPAPAPTFIVSIFLNFLFFIFLFSPTTSLSAPKRLSIALLMSCDLGNPLPYNHAIISLISKPAKRTAITIQSYVLVPANDNT